MKEKKVNRKLKEKNEKIKGVKIGEGFEIYDLALKYKDILIFGDFHLGYEESMNKQGILIPRFQIKDTISRVAKILMSVGEVETIVLTGDVKHEFGKIYDDEWMGVLALIDFMKEHCRRLIILEGNHDKVTKYITERREVIPKKEFAVDDLILLHGDIVPQKREILSKAKTVIIGHEHPAITLREKKESIRTEKLKCFIKGMWKGKDIIVLPSFNLLTEGNDIRGKLLSPFLKGSLKKFEIWVVADKVRYFGRLKDLA